MEQKAAKNEELKAAFSARIEKMFADYKSEVSAIIENEMVGIRAEVAKLNDSLKVITGIFSNMIPITQGEKSESDSSSSEECDEV